MKILVTGGSGYIGSVLVNELLALGHSVTVLDKKFPNAVFANLCRNFLFRPVVGDCRDIRRHKYLIEWADAIIPLAGLVGAPICKVSPKQAFLTNTQAVRELLDHTSSQQMVVMPATDSGYPQGPVDENSPMNPASVYAVTKQQAENLVLGCGGVTLRLASTFGMAPSMRTDLIVNDFVWRAVKDGALMVFEPNYRRNFVHVVDVAHAFIHALEHYDKLRGEPFNVGDSAARMTKLELCTLIRDFVNDFRFGVNADALDPDRRDCVVSNAKFEATGWKAEYSLTGGVQELIKGYSMMENRPAGR